MQTSRRWIVLLAIVGIFPLFVSEDIGAQAPKPSTKPGTTTTATGVAGFVRACKEATALVNMRQYGSGSAFCVSNDGIFLTNRHVVGDLELGESVDLVLNAGEKSERVLKAKLVHISDNEDVDLAILKTVPVKDVVALKLGDDSRLEETASVTAFGFPFGRSLAGTKQQFPNVTVTSGKVSALRRRDGALEAIQVDAAINPGCSGGPLVDSQGKVVGVVFGVVPLSGIAFAIPISKAREYLQTPRVVLSHPEIRYSSRHDSQRIEIEVVELTPSTKPVTVELTLHADAGKPRTLRAERKGSQFEVQAELFNRPTTPSALKLKVWQGQTGIEVRVPDQSVKHGTNTLPLSACVLIQRRAGTHLVTTVEGDKFAATLSNLPKVKLANSTELDLGLAERIQIFVEDSSEAEVSYEVTARRNGDSVATATGVIRCSGRPRRATEEYPEEADLGAPPIQSLTIEALVDGKSSLRVTPDSLYWEHHENGLPGTADGDRRFVLVNGRKWFLRWHKNYDGKSVSEPLLLKVGGLSHDFRLLSLRDKPNGPHNAKRSKTKFEEHPVGAQPSRILFDDQARGSGLYKVSLTPKMQWSIPVAVGDRLNAPTSARWTFDADTSDAIHDATGNGHLGHGPSPKPVEGRIGKSMSFDGAGVNCGNIGDFERTDAFSLGGWTYLTNIGQNNEICGRMDGRDLRGYDLIVKKDRLVFHLFNHFKSGNGIKAVSVAHIQPFRWYHFFATYDGSGNSSGLRLYIDGSPAEFYVDMDNLKATTKVELPFYIGMRAPGSPDPELLRGQLDEVCLFNRVLSPEEVHDVAFANRPGLAAIESKSLRDKLIGVWSFDDVKQDVVPDTSDLGHNGTLKFAEQDIAFEAGKFGKAVRLNKRVIQFTTTTGDFERTDAFSFGAWVNRTDKPNQSLISKLEQRPPFRGFDLMVQNGAPRIGLCSVWDAGRDEPQRALLVLGQEQIPANEWHHLLATYDGSSKASGVTIYLDGKSIPVKIEKDTLDGTIRTPAPLCLGNRFNDPNGAYDGLIDDAVIFARCLTAVEVLDLIAGKSVKP